jgi:L-aminopeptidase/D-esterase-like protein
MKGGLGSHAYKFGDLYVGAVVAVNAAGQVVDPDTGDIIAGRIDAATNTFIDREEAIVNGTVAPTSGNTNTTIGCVVTNAVLTQANANKLAEMAHDGYARAIEPTHTPSDGDCIFAMATGTTTTTSTTWDVVSANMSLLGVLAVNAMERAIVSACYNAESVTDSAGVTTVGAATLRAEGKTPAQPAKGASAVEDIEAFIAQLAADKADVDYVVVAGDTVSKIAIRYGLAWKELAQYNKLANPNLIYVGQTLKIPQ